MLLSPADEVRRHRIRRIAVLIDPRAVAFDTEDELAGLDVAPEGTAGDAAVDVKRSGIDCAAGKIVGAAAPCPATGRTDVAAGPVKGHDHRRGCLERNASRKVRCERGSSEKRADGESAEQLFHDKSPVLARPSGPIPWVQTSIGVGEKLLRESHYG